MSSLFYYSAVVKFRSASLSRPSLRLGNPSFVATRKPNRSVAIHVRWHTIQFVRTHTARGEIESSEWVMRMSADFTRVRDSVYIDKWQHAARRLTYHSSALVCFAYVCNSIATIRPHNNLFIKSNNNTITVIRSNGIRGSDVRPQPHCSTIATNIERYFTSLPFIFPSFFIFSMVHVFCRCTHMVSACGGQTADDFWMARHFRRNEITAKNGIIQMRTHLTNTTRVGNDGADNAQLMMMRLGFLHLEHIDGHRSLIKTDHPWKRLNFGIDFYVSI